MQCICISPTHDRAACSFPTTQYGNSFRIIIRNLNFRTGNVYLPIARSKKILSLNLIFPIINIHLYTRESFSREHGNRGTQFCYQCRENIARSSCQSPPITTRPSTIFSAEAIALPAISPISPKLATAACRSPFLYSLSNIKYIFGSQTLIFLRQITQHRHASPHEY